MVERTYRRPFVPARAQALPAAHRHAQGRARGARLPARQFVHERPRVPRRPEVREVARPARGRTHDELRQEAAHRPLDRPRARHDAAGVERGRERAVSRRPARRRHAHAVPRRRRARRARLAEARLSAAEIGRAPEQLVENLRLLVGAGFVHADLSAYNLLWWEDELWFIDFPQAVDVTTNPHTFDYLYRDVANVGGWFARHGEDVRRRRAVRRVGGGRVHVVRAVPRDRSCTRTLTVRVDDLTRAFPRNASGTSGTHLGHASTSAA